jgi:Flp pilus assembly protein TadG
VRVRGNERGSALVEMAVTMPVLLLVVLGIVVFGVALSNYISLTNIVGQYAQLVAVSRGQTTNPCLTAITSIGNGGVASLTAASLNLTFTIDGTSYGPFTASAATATTCASPSPGLVQGTSAKVTATYPCSLTILGVNYGGSPCNLSATMTEIIQ